MAQAPGISVLHSQEAKWIGGCPRLGGSTSIPRPCRCECATRGCNAVTPFYFLDPATGQVLDESRKQYYWYNTLNGKSQWELWSENCDRMRG